MKLINGKEIAAAVRAELKADCATFVAKHGYAPGLAVVIVGEDPASQIYVRNKARACEEVGFCSEVHRLPAGTEQAALNALIDRLNADSWFSFRFPRIWMRKRSRCGLTRARMWTRSTRST